MQNTEEGDVKPPSMRQKHYNELIRSQWGEFTQVKLAEMYGVSLGTIQYYLKYREQRGHAGGKIDHWSPDDDDRLREALARGDNFRQAAAYVGRSQSATQGHAYRLGLKSGQPPTRSVYGDRA